MKEVRVRFAPSPTAPELPFLTGFSLKIRTASFFSELKIPILNAQKASFLHKS